MISLYIQHNLFKVHNWVETPSKILEHYVFLWSDFNKSKIKFLGKILYYFSFNLFSENCRICFIQKLFFLRNCNFSVEVEKQLCICQKQFNLKSITILPQLFVKKIINPNLKYKIDEVE